MFSLYLYIFFIIYTLIICDPTTPESTINPLNHHNLSTPKPTSDDIREILRESQIESDDTSTFYMCPPPSGSTLVRLEPPRACPNYKLGKNFTEGIAVIFKENISPYKFKANIYYKNIIITTVWSGSTYAVITNRYTDRVPIGVPEITELIDRRGMCLSKADYIRNNYEFTAFDKDEDPREVHLKPSKFNTPGSRGWHTVNDTYTKIGGSGFYHSGTSVNCIVEEVDARSVYPYDSFAISTGDIIHMSPFFGLRDGAHTEYISYSTDRFQQIEGYYPIDLDTRLQLGAPVSRNFLTTQHVTVAWNWVPKIREVCTLAKWREIDEIIRDEYKGSYRFTAKSISATFISDTTQFDIDRVKLSDCAKREAIEAIDKIYKKKYNKTHIQTGELETYLARGGFIIAFRPMISNELAKLYINELVRSNRTVDLKSLLNPSVRGGARKRRSVEENKRSKRNIEGGIENVNNSTIIKTTSSVHFAMLQFAYDHIQSHVNEMLSRIATAWCNLQNKERTLWNEVMKLNPTSVASVAMDQRVSARMLGDVLAVTQCVNISGSSVFIQNSMRVLGSTTTCYSRPLISFKALENSTNYIEGQLGENNELLVERKLIEPCTANHKRYFKFGVDYVYFENYAYVRKVPLNEIEMISAYVDLNITLLEDREFLPLEVYTRAELEDTGLLDYSEIQRRNQLHALKFYDIDSVVKVDNNVVIMRGIANFFQGLGDVGAGFGKVVLGAANAVIATVSGVSSFLNNPFGALAVGLLILAGLFAAFLAYRYVSKLKSNPMKALYPVTTRNLKESVKNGNSGNNSDGEENDDNIDEEKLQQAKEMIKYMSLVSAMEQQEHKAIKKNSGPALLASHITNLSLKHRGPKYKRLKNVNENESKV
ncbi:envelope glycoprotein B [Canid alphaherpesvirus 1]|uniref:Glycoprotein B n=9 Tax=Canid alphaherpesvirus 1 TaxID=170325 RepID=Q91SD0_9ALPH|nr:envelope glycoprotein B [Canid alphaherpesvirus 1]AAK51052.1 glycoprotein B [Canid alphaherpesvirus 1]AEK27122.1 glycoprotein B [Canid alphaherpesvirus 1]ALL25907.1 envelope glycoprotein B [Canid alphaherpesvirus 1]ALL25987.1 envelope glycoprotein B [Canid alphaherpesvirus 1]ALL26063.1 envelope glycoprotein B [Canid alphaherpesvirus 1]